MRRSGRRRRWRGRRSRGNRSLMIRSDWGERGRAPSVCFEGGRYGRAGRCGSRVLAVAAPAALGAAVDEVVAEVVAAIDAGAAAEAGDFADEAAGDGQGGPGEEPEGGEKQGV